MERSIIISGAGGQGALFAGQILAYAAMDSGKQVTWIPSYGPEMRGGTAHCTVIIGDEPIGSPLVRHPDIVLAMNLPSVDKYEPLIKSHGLLVVNQNLVERTITRGDIEVILIRGNELALRCGDARLLNMVMLGALLAKTPILPLSAVDQALVDHLPERHSALLEADRKALSEGARQRQIIDAML
jgi:2-oxoglutarate ferredoxin oxidoreductase subunit gamma